MVLGPRTAAAAGRGVDGEPGVPGDGEGAVS